MSDPHNSISTITAKSRLTKKIRSGKSFHVKQLSFKKVGGWGGKRKGAGRKNKSGQVSHAKRVRIKHSTPLHATWRLKKGLSGLRCEEFFDVFKKASLEAQKFGLRLLHFSIQGNHLHLIFEARNNETLAQGMRSFGGRIGKAIRRKAGGVGSVFDGRYHLHAIATVSEMKNALAYVLQNTAKHSKLLNHLDRYSSAPYFDKWRKLLSKQCGPLLVDHEAAPLPRYLCEPRSWLAREGWMRARIQ